MITEDQRRHAPATSRNREPILDVLRRVLPLAGLVLELASGSGEHAMFFAERLPELIWQPTDRELHALASIEAYRQTSGPANLRTPLLLDASAEWPIAQADAVVCINMIHISPWAATEGLMAGAGAILPPGGILVLYGPFKEDGRHTADSNRLFDEDLRRRDPEWGVRDLADVSALAAVNGLEHNETVTMPANNRCVIFRKIG